MLKTFKYRIYPTKHQRKVLVNTLELCRWIYNETLSTRKNAWEQEQKSLSCYDTMKLLPEWKEQKPELKNVYGQVLQQVCTRVDLAFQAFFRRVKTGENPGYPRFKGYGRYDSFTYTQNGFCLKNDGLHLSKIGTVKIKLHRNIQGKVKTLTIRRDNLGKWYACFSCEVDSNPLPKSEKVTGIDVGLESFATLSNGEKISNPRFFKNSEKKLAKAQCKLSKAEKGTKERSKRRKVVAHIHQRVANQRQDFAHKLSRKLINEYGVIVFEKLNKQKMMKNHYLAKSIADAAWNQLIQYTTYKAEDAGRKVILVNPSGTSQCCSQCCAVVKKSLAVRTHSCPHCGLVLDRDENAALNILRLGLQAVG
jgi:putative transposase